MCFSRVQKWSPRLIPDGQAVQLHKVIQDSAVPSTVFPCHPLSQWPDHLDHRWVAGERVWGEGKVHLKAQALEKHIFSSQYTPLAKT